MDCQIEPFFSPLVNDFNTDLLAMLYFETFWQLQVTTLVSHVYQQKLGQVFCCVNHNSHLLCAQFMLQRHDNPLWKKFNDVVNEIRHERCSTSRLRLCQRGDPSGMFFSNLIEDKNRNGPSYFEFLLVQIHREIQKKLSLQLLSFKHQEFCSTLQVIALLTLDRQKRTSR